MICAVDSEKNSFRESKCWVEKLSDVYYTCKNQTGHNRNLTHQSVFWYSALT